MYDGVLPPQKMKQENAKKKGGRPPIDPKNKAITPNITIPPSLQDDGIKAAAREGISWSAFVAAAINKEIARVEMKHTSVPLQSLPSHKPPRDKSKAN